MLFHNLKFQLYIYIYILFTNIIETFWYRDVTGIWTLKHFSPWKIFWSGDIETLWTQKSDT